MRIVPRDEALRRAAAARPSGACLVCSLRDAAAGAPLTLATTREVTVLLTRYPRRWGHVLVLVNRHVTRFVDLEPECWVEASAAAHQAARMLESTLGAKRCYVASLGTVLTELPASSPHIHLHVVPIHDEADTPGRVFSWDEGIVDDDEPAWMKLAAKVKSSAPLR